MKRIAGMVLVEVLIVLLVVSCRREENREQKITIKIDAPDAAVPTGVAKPMKKAQPEKMADSDGRSVPHVIQDLVSHIEDIKPVLQEILEDQRTRNLVKAGKTADLKDHLLENHEKSVGKIMSIMEAKDAKAIAWLVANHMIRKSKQGGAKTRRPQRPRRR
jgi:hypothetical protein